MKILSKKIIALLVLSLSIGITGCSNTTSNIQDDLPENKETIEKEIITKRISGETSRDNLIKIKEQLFSGDELNNFKCKIVNIDPYTPANGKRYNVK